MTIPNFIRQELESYEWKKLEVPVQTYVKDGVQLTIYKARVKQKHFIIHATKMSETFSTMVSEADLLDMIHGKVEIL